MQKGSKSGTFFLCLALIAAFFTIFWSWPAWHLFNRGTLAEGTITNVIPDNSGGSFLRTETLSISFETTDGRNFAFTESPVLYSSEDFAGQNIEILYDPANPTTATSFKFLTTNALFLLVLILIIGYSIFLILKDRKQSKTVSTDIG